MSVTKPSYTYSPYRFVASGDTLLAGFTSVIDAAAAVTLTPPAVPTVADGKSFFEVIATGNSALTITGLGDMTAPCVRRFVASADNSAWVELEQSAATALNNAWLDSANAGHSTGGLISFQQVKNAIFDEYRYFNSGTWDANDAPLPRNQYVSGSSGVTTNNFPQGLSAPAAFISEYYGNATDGVQRLTIFGLPTSSRGVWSRIYQGGISWSTWQLETPNYFDFTPAPATQGQTYTVESGNVAINDGDFLVLRAPAIKSSMRVTPVTDWANVETIDLDANAKADGWTIVGTQPTSGNSVIDLFTDNFAKQWVLRAGGNDTFSLAQVISDEVWGTPDSGIPQTAAGTIEQAVNTILNTKSERRPNYTDLASLPDPQLVHGMIAHVHGGGTALGAYYFADYNADTLVYEWVPFLSTRNFRDIALQIGGVGAYFQDLHPLSSDYFTWTADQLAAAFTPFYFPTVADLVNYDTTVLRDGKQATIKDIKKAVFFDKYAGSGDYTPAVGGGFWIALT